ncbi:response regulator [Bremerella cremea]|uniref:Response regulator n=1 Tax=Bremerella cremea TaxID=1031537 RepID=A0A368KPQ1_9BACT|nr:HDOD domain-containing protein [Bremerella cremea]RCS43275.1 response regulator [Bremerella cremea]
MKQKQLRALLVDDDSLTRLNLRFFLEKEGFVCEYAEDGREALWKMGTSEFDVVITDLKMPNMHGHALAIELLSIEPRPLISVLTGIPEPQIMRDLIIRGVDDVTLKSTNFIAYGAKVRAMVDLRRLKELKPATKPEPMATKTEQGPARQLPGRVKLGEGLAEVVQALPLSPRAIEVYRMAHEQEIECEEIAACVATDPSLTCEILRIGNSSAFNSTNEPITDMGELINRIGRRRIGELALAASASNVLKNLSSAFIDIGLARRRSMAARLVAEYLCSLQTFEVSPGVLVGAVMHCLGHVALSTAFPTEYAAMLAVVNEGGVPHISEATRRVFGGTQSELMSRLLRYWKVPEQLTFSLSQIERSYDDAIEHPERVRKDIELLKLSILIGWIACGRWEPHDIVEIPNPTVAKRLRLGDVCGLIDNVRQELQRTASPAKSPEVTQRMQVHYRGCAMDGFDFLAELLTGFGLDLVRWDGDRAVPVIINGLSAREVPTALETNRDHTLVICDEDLTEAWSSYGKTLALPASYASLEAAVDNFTCLAATQKQTTAAKKQQPQKS